MLVKNFSKRTLLIAASLLLVNKIFCPENSDKDNNPQWQAMMQARKDSGKLQRQLIQSLLTAVVNKDNDAMSNAAGKLQENLTSLWEQEAKNETDRPKRNKSPRHQPPSSDQESGS